MFLFQKGLENEKSYIVNKQASFKTFLKTLFYPILPSFYRSSFFILSALSSQNDPESLFFFINQGPLTLFFLKPDPKN